MLHMLENLLENLHTKERNAAFYLEEIKSIETYARKVVEEVLTSPKYVNWVYRPGFACKKRSRL